jgi:hypothetical protein
MPSDTCELDEFLQFAADLKTAGTMVSLDEAMQRFRGRQRFPARTPLVRTLDQLRAQFIAEGGTLLTADQIEQEVRERRGAHFAEEPQ